MDLGSLKDFSSLLGGQRSFVGISITPGLGVEVICLNPKDKTLVTNYAKMPLDYDLIQRDITDYDQLKDSVENAFNQLNIDPGKCDACVVVPNVYFDIKELNCEITDDERRLALLTEVEDSFLFRGKEVTVTLCDSGYGGNEEELTKNYIHSALDEEQLNKIRDTIEATGVNIVAIETSHSAMLRGIEHIEKMKEAIDQYMNWNILLINNNSFAIFSLSGKHLKKYVEIPLAIKSLSYEEAYQAVATSAAQNLQNFPAQRLLIISQADNISAEILRGNIGFEGGADILDFNRYTKKGILQATSDVVAEDAVHITLNVVGAALYKDNNFGVQLDFLNGEKAMPEFVPIHIGGKQHDVPVKVIGNILFGLAGFIFISIFLLTKTATQLTATYEQEKQNNDASIAGLQKQISALQDTATVKNIDDLSIEVINGNKQVLSAFTSIATDIPKNVWLTNFETKTGDQVFLEGMSLGIKDVYTYYRNLKTTNPASTVELKQLKIITDILTNSFDAESNEKRVYFFEISNMESTKAKMAAGNVVSDTLSEVGNTVEKAGIFDLFKGKGKKGGANVTEQEQAPSINDIQLESVEMGG